MRCEDCPLSKLDAAAEGHAGQLIGRASDHLFAAETLTIGYGDVTAEEFQVMKLIAIERDRLKSEQATNGGTIS